MIRRPTHFILKCSFHGETCSQPDVFDMRRFAQEIAKSVRSRPGPLLASLSSMTVVALIRRLRDEFTAMPGLRLS